MQIIKDGQWKKAMLLLRLAKEEKSQLQGKRKVGTINGHSEFHKAKLYMEGGWVLGSTHLKKKSGSKWLLTSVYQKVLNDTYILKNNKNSNAKLNTLFWSPWVLTWLCLGQHINWFKTHTENKRLFLQLSAKILYSSVQQPEEKQGNLWLGFLDNLIFTPGTIPCL